MFRHTYCAARLQTLDRGAPVSTYTVARELGHESEAMVRRVYAHLGEVRHRSEVVEYRVAQHVEQIGERLKKLGIVTGNVTAAPATAEMETPRDHGSDSGALASDPWAWVELNYRPHAYQRTRSGPYFRCAAAKPLSDRAICWGVEPKMPGPAATNGHHNGHHG
jgi:hypothetical protein